MPFIKNLNVMSKFFFALLLLFAFTSCNDRNKEDPQSLQLASTDDSSPLRIAPLTRKLTAKTQKPTAKTQKLIAKTQKLTTKTQ